jgi:hypothetical protein
VLVCSGGASCRQWRRSTEPITPLAFSGPPTRDDIVYAVNTNSARVRQLSTESATLTTAGAPSLRAKLDVERPLKIRLRGRFVVEELDLGSNDELLWFWAKSDPEQAVYYAYHQQFVLGAANSVLPIGPDWLIEAIGLVNLDPGVEFEGPIPRQDGSVEIRSRLDRRGTVLTRVLVIDSKYGWITEQQIIDLAGRPLAIARCSDHHFYPEAGASLPHRVQIQLPPAQLAFQLEVGKYTINQLTGDPNQLFSIPPYDGYRSVNLAEQRSVAVQPPNSQPSVYAPQDARMPHTAYRLKYRGFGETR